MSEKKIHEVDAILNSAVVIQYIVHTEPFFRVI